MTTTLAATDRERAHHQRSYTRWRAEQDAVDVERLQRQRGYERWRAGQRVEWEREVRRMAQDLKLSKLGIHVPPRGVRVR
jgi:hypothetical protein